MGLTPEGEMSGRLVVVTCTYSQGVKMEQKTKTLEGVT
jgi:hypothetical protein